MYSLVALENNSASRRRDTRVAIAVLLASWALFAALEQSPFKLQGAVLESLVERGRLHFVRGHMKDMSITRVIVASAGSSCSGWRRALNRVHTNGSSG